MKKTKTNCSLFRFLRPLNEYNPPEDVIARCEAICSRTLGSDMEDSTPITDPQTRFAILNGCFKEFKHSVPNSLLYSITTVGESLYHVELINCFNCD